MMHGQRQKGDKKGDIKKTNGVFRAENQEEFVFEYYSAAANN